VGVWKMISLYSGTPGSGKSFHMSQVVYYTMRSGHSVIGNFPFDCKKNTKGKYIYKDNEELTVQFLVNFARNNHKRGKEGQTLLCIDEAQLLFNCREFLSAGRKQWVSFFIQHRKLGYDVILVSVFDRLLDRQIRSLVEYEVIHRKVNNFKFGNIIPFTTFVYITMWSVNKEKIAHQFIFYRKSIARMYDSYKIFEEGQFVF